MKSLQLYSTGELGWAQADSHDLSLSTLILLYSGHFHEYRPRSVRLFLSQDVELRRFLFLLQSGTCPKQFKEEVSIGAHS